MFLKRFVEGITSGAGARREAKILHHFQNKPDVRANLAGDIAAGKTTLPDELSSREMVVVFSLLLNKHSLDEVIQRMTRISNEGWAQKFDNEFFRLLDQASRDFRRLGLIETGNRLVDFGKTTAQFHGNKHWAGKFEGQFYQRIEHQIQNQFKTG